MTYIISILWAILGSLVIKSVIICSHYYKGISKAWILLCGFWCSTLTYPTCKTSLNIQSYVLLNVGPPQIVSQIPVHLHRPWMNQELRLVGLFHQCLLNLTQIRNPNPIMKGQQTTNIDIKSWNMFNNPLTLPILFLDCLYLCSYDHLQHWGNNGHA